MRLGLCSWPVDVMMLRRTFRMMIRGCEATPQPKRCASRCATPHDRATQCTPFCVRNAWCWCVRLVGTTATTSPPGTGSTSRAVKLHECGNCCEAIALHALYTHSLSSVGASAAYRDQIERLSSPCRKKETITWKDSGHFDSVPYNREKLGFTF